MRAELVSARCSPAPVQGRTQPDAHHPRDESPRENSYDYKGLTNRNLANEIDSRLVKQDTPRTRKS